MKCVNISYLWYNLEDFWLIVVDVWERGFLGVDIGRILIAFTILFGFLILRRLFTRIVIGRIRRWVERSSARIDNRAVSAAENPVRFIPVVMGAFFALQYLDLTGLPGDHRR